MGKFWQTLYKRTKSHAVQFWSISVEAEADDSVVITKESGQLGTLKPIRNQEIINEGKNIGRSNETSPYEQACLEAESDWKKKHDEGYKSAEDMQIQVRMTDDSFEYRTKEEPDIVYKQSELGKLLDKSLPRFNTDAQGNTKPMLAKDWKKVKKKIEYPLYVEPKLDGVRCLMIVNNYDDVTFLSRSGKEYLTLAHIAVDILQAAEHGSDLQYPFILDGEVYSDELTFQEITAAVKKQSPNSLKLHLRVYDIINDKEMTQRRDDSSQLVQAIGSEFIHHIKWQIATDAGEVKVFHDEAVKFGYEGAMLRTFTGKYDQGQRSSNLLKVKEFDETEYPVQSLEYGQRGVEDLLAVCTNSEGKLFKAKIEGSKEQKIKFELEYQEAYETEKDIKLTVKHFGLTTDRLPRFPIGKALRLYE